MATCILIIGQSGAGKSRAIKTLDDSSVLVLQCTTKEMPFRKGGKKIVDVSKPAKDKRGQILDTSAQIMGWSNTWNGNVIVVDDFGYMMTNQFMSKVFEKGYDKYNEMALSMFNVIKYCKEQLPAEKTIYFVMHEDVNDATGIVKPKTLGKLLDDKVCIEGMFTIVLRCMVEDGKHIFKTNNSGCAKSPEEMFESENIDNDLAFVDATIREYYGLEDFNREVKENG